MGKCLLKTCTITLQPLKCMFYQYKVLIEELILHADQTFVKYKINYIKNLLWVSAY